MDREPLEPAVLAVELFQEEDRERKRHGAIYLLAIGCVVLGGAGVFAFMNFMPKTAEPALPLVSKPLINDKPTDIAASLYIPPTDETPMLEPPAGNPTISPTVPSTSPEGPKPKPSSEERPKVQAPFNPLSGSIIPQDWDPGQAPSGPGANPTQIEPVKAKEELVVLFTGKLGGTDPQMDADQVAATLRGSGANVTIALHYSMAGSVVGAHVIAAMPPAGVPSLASMLGIEPWKGSVEERLNNASGLINDRLRSLRVQEANLKAKYEEDATEVVVVREEIQKLNQGLSIIRSAKAPGGALIVVGIGSP